MKRRWLGIVVMARVGASVDGPRSSSLRPIDGELDLGVGGAGLRKMDLWPSDVPVAGASSWSQTCLNGVLRRQEVWLRPI